MSLTAADVAEILRLVESSSFDEFSLELDGLKLNFKRAADGSESPERPGGAASPSAGASPSAAASGSASAPIAAPLASSRAPATSGALPSSHSRNTSMTHRFHKRHRKHRGPPKPPRSIAPASTQVDDASDSRSSPQPR